MRLATVLSARTYIISRGFRRILPLSVAVLPAAGTRQEDGRCEHPDHRRSLDTVTRTARALRSLVVGQYRRPTRPGRARSLRSPISACDNTVNTLRRDLGL